MDHSCQEKNEKKIHDKYGIGLAFGGNDAENCAGWGWGMGIRDILADPERETRARRAFGAALKEARLAKGWTQEAAGRAVGIMRGAGVTFNLWENGKTFPNTERFLIAIRDELGVDARLVILQAEYEEEGEKREGDEKGENDKSAGPRLKSRTAPVRYGERDELAGHLRLSEPLKNIAILEAFNSLDVEAQILVRDMIERLGGGNKVKERGARYTAGRTKGT